MEIKLDSDIFMELPQLISYITKIILYHKVSDIYRSPEGQRRQFFWCSFF